MKPTTDEVVWEMVQHFNDFTTSAVTKCKTVTHDARAPRKRPVHFDG